MKTCKCGKELAEDARMCPGCGKPFAAPTSKTTLVIVGVIGVFGLAAVISVGLANGGSPPTPISNAKDNEVLMLAARGAKTLRDSARNPKAFDLNSALSMKDGAICYEYRAQNGFGGMNIGYAVLTPKGKLRTSESTDGHALWQKECAGKTGTDQTYAIELVLRAIG